MYIASKLYRPGKATIITNKIFEREFVRNTAAMVFGLKEGGGVEVRVRGGGRGYVVWVSVMITLLQLCAGQESCGGCGGGGGGGRCSTGPLTSNMTYIGRNAILQNLFRDYDSLVRPGADEGKATDVSCNLFINSVDSISVDTMETHRKQALQKFIPNINALPTYDYSLNIYMRQVWVDNRLHYDRALLNLSPITLDHKLYSEIWVPDIFFSNEKSSHVHCVTVPNSMIRIYPNGTVLYSARYTLGLTCHMSLERFPLDKQTCFMKLESYAYTTDEILLRWQEENPVQRDDLELPQFDLKQVKTENCTKSYITGSYACLKVTFYLERQYGYYMIQTFIPSILIVALSWVSFWINIDAVPARISLGVLTVLTLTTQSVGVWMSLPRVSYVKAIDVWMVMCVVMVFSAMLEFAIVNTLARKEIRRMSMRARKKASETDTDVPSDIMKRMMDIYQYGSPQTLDPNSRLLARRLDKLARKGFPAVFVVFNLIYWPMYLAL